MASALHGPVSYSSSARTTASSAGLGLSLQSPPDQHHAAAQPRQGRGGGVGRGGLPADLGSDAAHPGSVPMHKVNFDGKNEYDMIKNYKVLHKVNWRSRMVDGVTADDDKVGPVYKLEVICKLLRASDASVFKELAEFVLKRL